MNVLFIGNSYTYYNDMPLILAALAKENGKELHVDAVTKGGRKLYANLMEGDEYLQQILALCAEKTYDVLFLQEQSYFPLIDAKGFQGGVAGLKDLVGAKRTILYATWGRKEGCPLLEEHGWTSSGMTHELYNADLLAAELCGAEISPVGLCFDLLTRERPGIELYNPDLSHPSYAGSCVAALAHYKKIFGTVPQKLSSPDLDLTTLSLLADAVDRTVS